MQFFRIAEQSETKLRYLNLSIIYLLDIFLMILLQVDE